MKKTKLWLLALILVIVNIALIIVLYSLPTPQERALENLKKTMKTATKEAVEESGILLSVNLDSLKCVAESANNATLDMVLRLTGVKPTQSATGLTVIMKDAGGKLLTSYNPQLTVNPGINVFTIHFNDNATAGEISYLAVSTENPSIHISYDNETYGSIVKCK